MATRHMDKRVEAQVAIGLPVYNGERYLRATVEGLLSQTYGDFALVIVDNASTDATENIGRALAAADPRIHYVRNAANIGVFRNYDRAFELVRCRYFKWSSSNDYCAPRYLEACVSELEADTSVALAYPRTRLFAEDLAAAEDYPFDPDLRDADPVARMARLFRELRLNNAFNGVFRADWLAETGMNGEYQGSDTVVVAEMALRGHVALIDEPLFYRRMTPAAAGAARDGVALRNFFAGTSRDVQSTPVTDSNRQLLRAIAAAPLSAGVRWRAWWYIAHRYWWTKKDLWAEALGTDAQPNPASKA